ncbi:MAG: Uma2 family endonuclease [Acidobacteriota bacterium]
MASTPTQLMTFAEFEQLPDPRGGKYELRHGELIFMAPPKQGHRRIERSIEGLLTSAAGPAWVAVAELGFQPEREHEYRIADVALVSQLRWDAADPNGYYQGSPDLVIEVLSPSNTASEMADRRDLCLRTGAREFWLVDPDRRTVDVSTPDGHTLTHRSGSNIPLFCGGSLSLDEIFA